MLLYSFSAKRFAPIYDMDEKGLKEQNILMYVRILELEAERCSLDSLGAFTDEHYCGPAVTRRMHRYALTDVGWIGTHEQSSRPYLFKSS